MKEEDRVKVEKGMEYMLTDEYWEKMEEGEDQNRVVFDQCLPVIRRLRAAREYDIAIAVCENTKLHILIKDKKDWLDKWIKECKKLKKEGENNESD